MALNQPLALMISLAFDILYLNENTIRCFDFVMFIWQDKRYLCPFRCTNDTNWLLQPVKLKENIHVNIFLN